MEGQAVNNAKTTRETNHFSLCRMTLTVKVVLLC